MKTATMTQTERVAYWTYHVKQWKQSGLTRSEYSRKADCQLHQLCYWIKKEKQDVPSKAKIDFIPIAPLPVTQPETGAQFALKLAGGMCLQWNGLIDPHYLACILRELDS